MFYFLIQTFFLSLLVFIAGLFMGVFLKNMLCKQRLQMAASYDALRRKGRRHLSRRGVRREHVTVGASAYRIKPSESAALAKKRTAALVKKRRDNVVTVRSTTYP